MCSRKVAISVCLAAVAAVASTGCVSKKLFRQNVEDTDTRVAAVESGVEANERRIQDLSSETDSKISALDSKAEKAVEVGQSALSKADVASRTAEEAKRGKLIWEVTLTNDQVKFSFDQATIPPDASAILDDLVQKVKSLNRAVYLEILGYTDSTGTEAYNLALGEKRAMAVRNYLAAHGIPLHAMNVISYGEADPIADNSTSAGRAQNRRVVIRVLE